MGAKEIASIFISGYYEVFVQTLLRLEQIRRRVQEMSESIRTDKLKVISLLFYR